MRSHPSTEYTTIFHRLDGRKRQQHSMAVINCKMMPKLDRHLSHIFRTYTEIRREHHIQLALWAFDIHKNWYACMHNTIILLRINWQDSKRKV